MQYKKVPIDEKIDRYFFYSYYSVLESKAGNCRPNIDIVVQSNITGLNDFINFTNELVRIRTWCKFSDDIPLSIN